MKRQMKTCSTSSLASFFLRPGSFSAIACLFLFRTAGPCHAGLHVSLRKDLPQTPKRALSGKNIFSTPEKVQKDVTIIYVDYPNFFDDDAYIKKVIALPTFRLTLQLVNTYGSSSSDLALDLNSVLYGYLSDKISSSLHVINSLSLVVVPVSSTQRSLNGIENNIDSSLRRRRDLITTSTGYSFAVSGNATFSGGNSAYLTEQLENSTIHAMSDSTVVLNTIQAQSTNPALKNAVGVSTSIDGQLFSKVDTINNPVTSSSKPMIPLTLALGYGAIGLAGLGVLIAFFIVSRRSWKRKTFRQAHKNTYQDQSKATYIDIQTNRTKRVHFNQEANTVRTIASPTSTNNSLLDLPSPLNSNSNSITMWDEDVVDLMPSSRVEKTSWGHVVDMEDEVRVQDAQCIIADLNALPTPSTFTHQGFLDFLFGRPTINTSTSPNVSPVRVIGENDSVGGNLKAQNREMQVFETTQLFAPPVVSDVHSKPVTKKRVIPIPAIENLTFVSKFNVEETNQNVRSNDIPLCGNNFSQIPTPARACFQSERGGYHSTTRGDHSKKDSDLSSILSIESSSLELDTVQFIRQTMESNDLNDKNNLLEHSEISDDEAPFDCKPKNRVKISSYSAVLGSPPKGSRNMQHNDVGKVEVVNDYFHNRQRIPITAVVNAARSPDHGLAKRHMMDNLDHSLLESECDDDTEFGSDEDNGAIGYAKSNLINKCSPSSNSPERNENGARTSLGRLGANPVVNNSLLTLDDDDDVPIMDASYEGNEQAHRSQIPSSKTSNFVSEVKRYQQKKSMHHSFLDLDEENPSDHESAVDRYFSKQLTSSPNMKLSPKRRNEDGSFPKL